MKHDWKITVIMILIFLITQLVGLNIISQYIDIEQTSETGKTVTKYQDIDAIIGRPEIENESFSFIPIVVAVLVGTFLILLIAKYKLFKVWNVWFFLAILIGLAYAFHPYIAKLLRSVSLGAPRTTIGVTLIVAGVLAYLKTKKKNVLIHNITEIFIYGGIAALFINIINITAAIILLLLISVYDAYAVWKSKHMIKLAEFQAETKLFAGLFIPKGKIKDMSKMSLKVQKKSTKKLSTGYAVLGGGDIAFPLLFTGAVLKYTNSYPAAIIIALFATIALGTLLFLSKKGKFYPAMPFISAGCFVGYAVTLLF